MKILSQTRHRVVLGLSLGVALVVLVGCATTGREPGPGGVTSYLQNARALGRPLATAPLVTRLGVTFRVEAPEAVLVTVAGQFNGWDGKATPLTKDDTGVWSLTLPLRPGKHRYKFLIDGIWLPDPANPAFEPDGFGHYNSIVEVPR